MFAVGGTGGHLFPALSLAQEIRVSWPDAELLYVCTPKDLQSPIFRTVALERVFSVQSAPFPGRLGIFDIRFLLKLLAGFAQSLGLLVRERPDLVAGFGGYASFPVLSAALVLGKRTLIHEQTVQMGLANRVLSRWVDAVAVSFPETQAALAGCRNIRCTGNPIRPGIEEGSRQEALEFFGFSPGKRTLLVLGGSQGARTINTVFLEALGLFSEDFKRKVQVLFLCGRLDPSQAERALSRAGFSAKAYSFFERMDRVYAVTDLALGRAGATFLAEIAAKKIPAVLVPYPHGSGHQRVNASVFRRHHPAWVIEQGDLTPERLVSTVEEVWKMLEDCRRKTADRPATGRGGACPKSQNARKELLALVRETLGRSG